MQAVSASPLKVQPLENQAVKERVYGRTGYGVVMKRPLVTEDKNECSLKKAGLSLWR